MTAEQLARRKWFIYLNSRRAMKEGFAVRLADVEAKAERYRLALVECQRTMDSEAEMVLRNLRRIITEVLK